MKNAKQIFIAFLIPFLSAFLLLWLKKYIFAPPDKVVSLGLSDDLPPLQEQIYNFSIFFLFLLSALMPSIIVSRNKPIERNELKLSNITDKNL